MDCSERPHRVGYIQIKSYADATRTRLTVEAENRQLPLERSKRTALGKQTNRQHNGKPNTNAPKGAENGQHSVEWDKRINFRDA